MLFGDQAEITDKSKDFLKIITDYGYEGWARKSAFCENFSEPTHFVNVPFADLLPEKRNHFRRVTALPFGARIRAVSDENEPRYAIVQALNRSLFVHKNHISPIPNLIERTDGLRRAFAETALKYLGVQYRWGGRTFAGIDCSGLCFNSYRFNGVNIWRDADIERSPNLTPIDFNRARPGDLIFFKGHMALYLGNGRIVHSSATAGKVVIEKFTDNDYLKEIYICAGTLFR